MTKWIMWKLHSEGCKWWTMICGLGWLPISLMGMIVHGHGNERYAQYFNELWLNDFNFTIGSLLRLLWTLEKILVYESKMLFKHPLWNALFTCLLQGKSWCTIELKTPSENKGPKLLPKKFLLQMDNCVKDNKNKYLLAFLSLLMAKEVFQEVKLKFLVVGHTHEDIDGCFGYLSENLREQNIYILVDLMKGFHGLVRKTFHSTIDSRNYRF